MSDELRSFLFVGCVEVSGSRGMQGWRGGGLRLLVIQIVLKGKALKKNSACTHAACSYILGSHKSRGSVLLDVIFLMDFFYMMYVFLYDSIESQNCLIKVI